MRPKWFIYYSDGAVLDDSISPEFVPPSDIQAILWFDKSNRKYKTLAGYDYYVWKGGRWWGANDGGMFLYLFSNRPETRGWKKVLAGDWIPDEAYKAIMSRVHADQDRLNGQSE